MYVFECPVRWDDLDSYGHVNNVMLADYLQEARLNFVHRHLADPSAPHERAVVGHQVIEYLRPIPHLTAPLAIAMWVTRIGTSSYHLAYEVRDGETLLAKATTTMVAYDVEAAQSRPLNDRERAVLGEFAG
ncbi:MAG TPA: acyl-CoA thioesterase [Jiangellaceae bacterium]